MPCSQVQRNAFFNSHLISQTCDLVYYYFCLTVYLKENSHADSHVVSQRKKERKEMRERFPPLFLLHPALPPSSLSLPSHPLFLISPPVREIVCAYLLHKLTCLNFWSICVCFTFLPIHPHIHLPLVCLAHLCFGRLPLQTRQVTAHRSSFIFLLSRLANITRHTL